MLALCPLVCKNQIKSPEPSIIARIFTEIRPIKNYKSKKEHNLVDNLYAFKNSVNPRLSFTATAKQVADKIKRLEKIYILILHSGEVKTLIS